MLAAGTRVGPYEVVSWLGAGGMGEVYRARDTTLGREVALKTLPEELAQQPDRLAPLKQEARILASLNHAGIATVHGLVESDGGVPVLVMELVEGETLADRLRRGPVAATRGIQGRAGDRSGPGGGSREGRLAPRPQAREHPSRPRRPRQAA
jgi:serine/threonine protein kinase